MKLGMIGLGKMGSNMAKRLINFNHEVVVYDVNIDNVNSLKKYGAIASNSIEELINLLPEQKIIWVMVPAGEITENLINKLSNLLSKNDIIIDGGNSNYKESERRASFLKEKKIEFVDVGTSGGIWGLTEGYCLMVGGKKEVFEKTEPLYRSLAPENGYIYTGPSGSGHFVKMVHNGIEYGMMQAYAEGFELLHSKKEYDLDLHEISKVWDHGSVIRSWLLQLISNIFEDKDYIKDIRGYVPDSGEGRWTVEEAISQSVSMPVITLSLMQRFRSRKEETFSDKVLAALRNQFGGHEIKKGDK
ncbi:6-phosphogluconate dehydrogenase [Hypnocyclicus thermotrophus]|uniref:6-phosphogluconate dehydrogenase n=1 Tax=Hypnocyclicus thermotrophus TaxID=1627895 RepID=A0AA46I6G2_9FUSO|nr:decarboxylating 6-phosphogluconate dehydrogenase [Hypnocyclicus thermotrophus]TDT72430.1 6-phosphogluconate dehydrogenase [Hypnocyclicus thermotrophus]